MDGTIIGSGARPLVRTIEVPADDRKSDVTDIPGSIAKSSGTSMVTLDAEAFSVIASRFCTENFVEGVPSPDEARLVPRESEFHLSV